MLSSQVNIYKFRDPLLFLSARFEFEKIQSKNLSVRKWAISLNIDDQDLLLVLKNKKKISSPMVSKLSAGLKLSSNEEAYLEALVKFTNATTLKEKQVLEIVLAELSKDHQQTILVEDENVFSHWVHMAIISMSKLKDFHCDKESVRNFLCDEVSPEIVDEAVERLLKLSLVSYDDNGSLKKNYDNTTTKNDVYKKSPFKYYEQVSELAKRGIEVAPEEREYQCFSLAINVEKIPAYKSLIRDFRAKVCALAESDTSNEVYQFNMQFFPLTAVKGYSQIDSSLDSLKSVNSSSA